jgi:hypothetical protein
MATDKKISQLTSGAPAQGTDETVIARSGASFKLTVSDIVGILGSPITVANGGTGATTLTGYVKGNGTGAFTASSTVAGSDVSGNISGNAANVTGTVAVANGGTGQTTYTNGQLLIGNTTGNTLSKSTLTAGSGISITNGTGTITIAATASDPIPSGTSMLFIQTSAPTGWTKSTAHNDKALRVVSGTASSGGSVGFTSAFASQAVNGSIANTTATGTVSTSVTGTIGNTTTTATVSTSISGTVGNTTLSTAQMPSHGHSALDASNAVTFYDATNSNAGGTNGNIPRCQGTLTGPQALNIVAAGSSNSHNHTFSGSATSTYTGSAHNHSFSGSGTSTFTGSAHNHSFTGTAINLAVSYVDTIIATKD